MSDYKIEINSKTYEVSVEGIIADKARVKVNGKAYEVSVPELAASSKPAPSVINSPAKSRLIQTDSLPQESTSLSGSITSPLPGVILSLFVKEGDKVKRGQKLAVLEAMKMENDILATSDGTVKQVLVKEGDSVRQGSNLMLIA